MNYHDLLGGRWRALLRREFRPPQAAVSPAGRKWKSLAGAPPHKPFPGQRQLVEELVEVCRQTGLALPSNLRVHLRAPTVALNLFGLGEHRRTKDGGADVFIVGYLRPTDFVATLLHELRHASDFIPSPFGGELREARAEAFTRSFEW